jgi:hypothetical protein
VKEYYYYLDSTPTHSYMKYLYKYPQNAYPYGDLIETSRRRGRNGGAEKFQRDPQWRDHLLFYEYFHGDNGAGLGASHQTGWTGGVALLIEIFGKLDAKTFLQGGREATFGPEKETV